MMSQLLLLRLAKFIEQFGMTAAMWQSKFNTQELPALY
jgi:hypothetical protein